MRAVLVPIFAWGVFWSVAWGLLAGCAQTIVGDPVEGFAQASDGARLGFRKLGHGPAFLVVAGAEAATLDLARLARGRTIVLSRPRLPAPPPAMALDREVEDLETLRRWLGLERFALLATGESRAAATGYAARHADRVEALVLAGPPAAGEADGNDVATRVSCPTLVLDDPTPEELVAAVDAFLDG